MKSSSEVKRGLSTSSEVLDRANKLLHSMSEPEVQPLVALVGRRCQIVLFFFFRHTAPDLFSSPA